MSGIHNGAQAIIRKQQPTAIFSFRDCLALNLCGSATFECIPEAITSF